MEARFTVLASGSSGNSSLLEVAGFGLLIDCGLAPRTLSHRLASIGSSLNAVHAVLLTHTHGDHWKDATLARLRSLRIPIFAHQAHLDTLSTIAPSFEGLHKAKLARTYRIGEPLPLGPSLACKPILVPHDSEPTVAFRIDLLQKSSACASLGFASDLGHVPAGLAEEFAGVDVLAVEYNHDVPMQKASGRPQHLIQRVLGKNGHLSNTQAGDFTRDVIACSGGTLPRAVVQLHLSHQCNTPVLAIEAGKKALSECGRAVAIVTARQDVPARTIPLEASATPQMRSTVIPECPAAGVRRHFQPQLPGFGV